MRPPRLEVQKVKYGELFRCLAEQEQAMTAAEQLFLVMGKCSATLLGMLIFYADPVSYFADGYALLKHYHFDVRKVRYGELFRLFAEQEQALASAEQLFLIQGEVFPDLHGMLIFYTPPTSRQCDPPEHEWST